MKEKVLLTVSGHAIDFLLGEFFSGVGGGLGCVGSGGGGKIPYMWRHNVFGFMAAVV